MPEQSSSSERPVVPPWSKRRIAGAEMPRRTAHSWSTRRTTSNENANRLAAQESELTRAAEELLAESGEAAPRSPTDAAALPNPSSVFVPVTVDGPPEMPPLTAGASNAPDFSDFDQAVAALTGDDIARLNSLAGPDDDLDELLLADDDDDLDPFSGFEEELSGRNARSRPSSRRLGAGLVALPRVDPVDPATAVLEDPIVPEPKRFCWKCQVPVGRSGASGPGTVAGECAGCGSPYNFRPALTPGEVVADQYVVKGCLAHGGLGWIYLAVDTNVSERWVVLKGLQNPQDFEAHVVALAERQFLSEITHPGVVKIYNFVKHRSDRDVADGYIVMEYVGGRSLKKLLDLAGSERLPVAQSLAYMMEILPALDYLHSFGLAYNDLKPDNIMVTDDEVKLIDLGAVAAMESYGSIYGTPGYQAPEIIETGPTVVSDIYAVGRTLAALVLDLRKDANGDYCADVPAPEDYPVLQRHPSLHRLLVRATHEDPVRRFPSAYAMYCQLAGVLRMVLAAETGREHPQGSVEFGSLRGDFGIDALIGQTDGMVDGGHRPPALDAVSVVAALPVPLIDADDPSVELLNPVLHGDARQTLDALRRTAERIAAGTIDAPETFEVEGALAAIRAHLDLGDRTLALALLDTLRPRAVTDWRIEWFAGVTSLLDGSYERAYMHFDEVHTMLPGEIAPALALAATAELVLQNPADPDDTDRWHRAAANFYQLVWQTNHGVISAAFGLARRLAVESSLLQAVHVLDEVPDTSRHHGTARMTGSLLLVSRPHHEITEVDLLDAASRLELADEPRSLQLQVVVVGAALDWLRSRKRPAATDTTLLGYPLTVPGLRAGLESRLRAVARTAPDWLHRYRLVDLANSVRPQTRW
ncbi:serine/threonine-protein kinase [Nocardia sp. NBC_01329]|uniref:serine/threonine-protein kinase n=1 Tax=Nocardia sp. NBC_01329 TaxID=2903594 RepID=UPI002E128AC7|nr:serine/threonine-protein kinase PknG [Nocardia sp. NBC_01329]